MKYEIYTNEFFIKKFTTSAYSKSSNSLGNLFPNTSFRYKRKARNILNCSGDEVALKVFILSSRDFAR